MACEKYNLIIGYRAGHPLQVLHFLSQFPFPNKNLQCLRKNRQQITTFHAQHGKDSEQMRFFVVF